MGTETIAIIIGLVLVVGFIVYRHKNRKPGSGWGKGPGKKIDNPK
jgi:hypothetical protein